MNLSKVLKRVYQEAKISDLFPITHLNSPTIFESQAGLVGSVLRISGIPFEIAEPDTLNHQKFILHQALLGLDSRFITYVTTHRKKTTRVLKGEFKSKFAKDLDEKYHERFRNQNIYVNDLYLTVVLKGDDSNKTGSLLLWAKKISGKNGVVKQNDTLQLSYIF